MKNSSNKIKGLFNSSVITYVVGTLLLLNGMLMLLCIPFSIIYDSDENLPFVFFLCSGITLSTGFFMRIFTKKDKYSEIKKRDVYLIVVLGDR